LRVSTCDKTVGRAEVPVHAGPAWMGRARMPGLRRDHPSSWWRRSIDQILLTSLSTRTGFRTGLPTASKPRRRLFFLRERSTRCRLFALSHRRSGLRGRSRASARGHGPPCSDGGCRRQPGLRGLRGPWRIHLRAAGRLRHGDRNGNGTIELSGLVAHVQDRAQRLRMRRRRTRCGV